MKRKTIIALVGGAVVMALAFMIFGQHGSLDPTNVGFYTAIGAAVLWFAIMYFLFKKVIKRSRNRKDPNNF